MAVGLVYVNKYFNEKSKKAVVDIGNDIQHEFTNILQNTEWMDDDTKSEALKKIKVLRTFIATPDGTNETAEMDEYYRELKLDANDFFKNILRITSFEQFQEHRRIYRPDNNCHSIIRTKTAVVNAFYSLIENSICKLYIHSTFCLLFL